MSEGARPGGPIISNKNEIIRSSPQEFSGEEELVEDNIISGYATPTHEDETAYGTLKVKNAHTSTPTTPLSASSTMKRTNINKILDPEEEPRSFHDGGTPSTASTANTRKAAPSSFHQAKMKLLVPPPVGVGGGGSSTTANKKLSKNPKQRLSDLIRDSVDEIRASVRDSVDHHEIIEDVATISPRDREANSDNTSTASGTKLKELFSIFAYPPHIEYWNAITMFAMPCIPVLYLYSQNLLVRESPFVYQGWTSGFSSDTPSPFDDDSNFFLYLYRLCGGVTAVTVDYTRSTSIVREQRQLTRLPDPAPENIIHMGQNLELAGGGGGAQQQNDLLIRSHPSPLVQFLLSPPHNSSTLSSSTPTFLSLITPLSLISIKTLNYLMIIPASIGSHIFAATHGRGSYWWTRADNLMIGIAAMWASYLLLESLFWTLLLYFVITIPFLVFVEAKSIEVNTAEAIGQVEEQVQQGNDSARSIGSVRRRSSDHLHPLKKKDVRLWTVFYRLITKKRLRATTNLEHTLLTIVLPGPPFFVLFAAGVLARFLIVWESVGIGEVGIGKEVQRPEMDYLEVYTNMDIFNLFRCCAH